MPFKIVPKLYTVWQSMLRRCYTPTTKQYSDYGGRGITVCDEWRHDFARFVADMGPRPDGMTLEREDNARGYSKGNCKWATRSEQQRNRRCGLVTTVIEGVEYRLVDLVERSGVRHDIIKERAARGLPLSEVLKPGKLPSPPPPRSGVAASAAARKARTHCPHGHEFSPANTMMTKDGARRCRTCHGESVKRSFERCH